MSDEVKLPENLSVYLRSGEYLDNQQIAKLNLIFQQGIEQQAESAAKIAELERRCLIAERAVHNARLGGWPAHAVVFKQAEIELIAESKIPQMEVKR